MARKRQEEPQLSKEELLAREVSAHRAGNVIQFSIGVNPRLDPTTIEEDGGVAPTAEEVDTAERAMAIRVKETLGNERATLQDWVKAQQKRLETKSGKHSDGLPRLAAELLGIPYTKEAIDASNDEIDPATGRKKHTYRNELRKLQEYAEGKYKSASGVRREQIANYRAGRQGNPYAPAPQIAGRALMKAEQITAAVTGKWRFSQTVQDFTKHYTSSKYHGVVQRLLLADGSGLVEAVVESQQSTSIFPPPRGEVASHAGEDVELLWVYGIHIIIKR